jgi:hypothetical protein
MAVPVPRSGENGCPRSASLHVLPPVEPLSPRGRGVGERGHGAQVNSRFRGESRQPRALHRSLPAGGETDSTRRRCLVRCANKRTERGNQDPYAGWVSPSCAFCLLTDLGCRRWFPSSLVPSSVHPQNPGARARDGNIPLATPQTCTSMGHAWPLRPKASSRRTQRLAPRTNARPVLAHRCPILAQSKRHATGKEHRATQNEPRATPCMHSESATKASQSASMASEHPKRAVRALHRERSAGTTKVC